MKALRMKIKIKENAMAKYWNPKCQGQYIPTKEERTHADKLEAIQGMTIEVKTDFLFCDQYNTKPIEGVSDQGMRIMEASVSEVIDDIRDTVGKCPYCGHHTPGKIDGFCESCLDSSYLDEQTIKRGGTRIRPVDAKQNREKWEELTQEEWDMLKPQYVKRQTTGKDSRNAEKLRKQRARLHSDHKAKTEALDIERDGMIWLMDNNISVENCIYYSHRKVFCFGWRNKISKGVKKVLDTKLQGFPFQTDFKVER
jgi:hypothetical protein